MSGRSDYANMRAEMPSWEEWRKSQKKSDAKSETMARFEAQLNSDHRTALDTEREARTRGKNKKGKKDKKHKKKKDKKKKDKKKDKKSSKGEKRAKSDHAHDSSSSSDDAADRGSRAKRQKESGSGPVPLSAFMRGDYT